MILNNMLGEEDLNPLGFHRIAPGRRVPSMMAPTVVLRDGEIVLGLGSAGSNRIRSAILQTVVRAVEQGMAPATAVRAPRLHFEQGVVQAEPGIDEEALARLEARGVPVARRPAINLFFGGVQAVARDPRDRRAQRRRRPAPRRRRRVRVSDDGGMARTIDFEAEGLLDGLEGEAREARLDLLERARRPKASRWRSCARRSPPARLTLLPVERALAGDGPPLHAARNRRDRRRRPRAAAAGFSAALGIPYPDPDERSADRGRPRGGAADEGLPRRRPARGRDAAGGADDRDGHGADRRGQPRADRSAP